MSSPRPGTRPSPPLAALQQVRGRVEQAVFAGVMGLPEPVQRRLAGRPVVRDGQTLAAETQLMLRLQRVSGIPAVETLPIPQGRVALLHQSRLAGGALSIAETRDLEVAGMPARLYRPSGLGRGQVGPLLLFVHGGGFVYGDLDSHDAPCRLLAERAGVRVLAVDYRLAPEHPFPAACDDAVAAFRWVVEHAAELHADPARLAVGGDSAGGNLAANVALAAAREGLPLAFQLLVYPTTDAVHDTDSARRFNEGFFLSQRFMDVASDSYIPADADPAEERLSPLNAEIPDGLAPAYLCTAGFDPLRDEGEAYARRLSDAGVEVRLQRFPDQIHGFLNVVGVGRRSRACVLEIADALRAGLA
ncbi:alpha/beta hydrolase [Nocardioides sp. TRM66260-LWL]|uniref:alpha/beta hydrolase n=1 Tax=Nocardioides sp. TRM66260-LWL TaxID=2874478 RepID=UPI001CC7F360|nr:alpha/beta hydrolase [Nocardioides sp. TRM66260-LWL]MBZ5734876.1 alpha/beta hydrolase [Nocardioides sp. TRM66260-LWL]